MSPAELYQAVVWAHGICIMIINLLALGYC